METPGGGTCLSLSPWAKVLTPKPKKHFHTSASNVPGGAYLDTLHLAFSQGQE